MSLALVQGYSSAEDEQPPPADDGYRFSSDEEDDEEYDDSSAVGGSRRVFSYKSVLDESAPSNGSSGLPSALDAFTEVSGPPRFLNNSVEEQGISRDVEQQALGRQGRWRNRKEKKDLPAGVVVEAKPQLVGIHERVRSDIESNQSSAPTTTQEGGKPMPTATNPSSEDAAELLRMCLQCGIPKTYSSARGMVCPVCGDRPPSEASQEQKKKGSTIKDKEKSKRMRGQSSHATWKSETEMQLRQQFD